MGRFMFIRSSASFRKAIIMSCWVGEAFPTRGGAVLLCLSP